jgi:trans-aconitate methyltransferase
VWPDAGAAYDPRMKQYYSSRAAEYDATSWNAFDPIERQPVERFVASLPSAQVVDIGCGTGYPTRLLRGRVVAVDQSAEMLELARSRAVRGTHLSQVRAAPRPWGPTRTKGDVQ